MKQLITILFLFNSCFFAVSPSMGITGTSNAYTVSTSYRTDTTIGPQVTFNYQKPDTINIVDLFVIAGQSNTGRPLSTYMTAPEAALYAGARSKTYILNPWVNTDTFQIMNVGTNCFTENANVLQYGPEASLFKLLEHQGNKERYVVKMGIGGTSMEGVWRPGRLTFTNLMKYTDTAISRIVAKGKTPRFVAFIFQQGEADATSLTNSGLYYANMVKFWNSADSAIALMYRRRGLPMLTPYKKIIGRIKPNPQVSYTYASVVREAQERYCKNFNAVLNDCDSYPMLDDEHFSATGQINFGTDIYNAIKNY